MTNDKTYCILSSKYMDTPCTNTDCDRHESNAPLETDNHRKWAMFIECEDYKGKTKIDAIDAINKAGTRI